MLSGRKILLIVSGSVAAYKVLEFTRLARKAGASVTAILTAGGARFVTKEVLAAITDRLERSSASQSSSSDSGDTSMLVDCRSPGRPHTAPPSPETRSGSDGGGGRGGDGERGGRVRKGGTQ